jgi:hypothetical protein
MDIKASNYYQLIMTKKKYPKDTGRGLGTAGHQKENPVHI